MNAASYTAPNDSQQARVITRFGEDVLVAINNQFSNTPIRCTAKRKFDHLVCGDYVHWRHNLNGNASIIELLPRKNTLTRYGFRGQTRTIAANIDQMVIVSAWLPEPDWALLDRYLIAAEQMNCECLIVMNKQDLKPDNNEAENALSIYRELGYQVIATDTCSSLGIDRLRKHMKHKTSILTGRSGVGKSSIALELVPELDIAVGDISSSGEGTHTTTTATLYQMTTNSYLIDSPGVRDFSPDNLTQASLEQGYIEFKHYLSQCKFHNCTHQHEPHCAIKQAVDAGKIHPQRYQHYIKALSALN